MAIDQARFARNVAKVVRESTVIFTHLVEGMWNPAYCSDGASVNAADFAALHSTIKNPPTAPCRMITEDL